MHKVICSITIEKIVEKAIEKASEKDVQKQEKLSVDVA